MSNQSPISHRFLYGTAWKEDLTEACVYEALRSGFKAIDTANQRKHYFEEGVGHALKRAYEELGLSRKDLFLQTKFTFSRGHDHRKTYDENAPLKDQVIQSFESSLEHLSTDYIDSYILHGPHTSDGINESDWEVWNKMEMLHQQGHVKYLGVSNISLDQIRELHKSAQVKPTFVQNRCFAETGWDKNIREFCSSNGIFYQGFSLLTANWKFLGGVVERPKERNIPHLKFKEEETELIHPKIHEILIQTNKTIQQVVFKFCHQVGIIPIVGTRSPEHMSLDLDIEDFELSEDQIKVIEKIAEL